MGSDPRASRWAHGVLDAGASLVDPGRSRALRGPGLGAGAGATGARCRAGGCGTVTGGPVRSGPGAHLPILVEAVDGETDSAPILETQAGWHRIEHRQRHGWIRTRDARVSSCAPWWWWKEGWVRTCLTFGGTWRLCTAREDGRLAAAFQRRYDRMDPVCGREPGHPQAPQGTCP